MQLAIPSLALVIFLFCLPPGATAQSKDTKPAATATVSGQVRLDGSPAPGVMVTLMLRNSGPQAQPLAKVKTDGEGRFRLMNVAAGTYVIRALAPGFISSDTQNYEQGKGVTVDEGEAVDGIDVALKRGAVITGRVEDAGHQPLVETDIELRKVDEQNRYVQFFNFYPFAYRTDDRGVYRLYGLPAGRYRVSVGRAAGDGGPILGPNAGYFLKTYYPNVTDESRAEIVEVKEGEEATNIDITVASRLKTFRATGRIVDRATSRPLANVSYGYGTVLDNSDRGGGKMLGGSAYVGSRTNSRGEFSLEDLVPGSYAAIVWNDGMIEGFADPAPFEIKDADVSGLEIKVQRGASISGMAIIEGTNDPKLYALLQNQTLIVQVKPQALESRNIRPPRIASDGSFRITGLRAGKAQIGAFSPSAERKIFLSRIEYNGSQQKELELKAGEEITDVQLIFVYGNGVIRGQVNFENGAMPESKQFFVFAALKNKEPQQNVSAIVDARGKFVIEGLQPGEYDLRLTEMFRGQGQAMQPLMKNVSVTNNAETRVVFDLAADGKSTGERDKDNR